MDGVAMTHFTITNDNNVTACASAKEAHAMGDGVLTFTSERELAKATAEWPLSRFAETWNSFAGVAPFADLKPVKKFTSRKAAVARIWLAVSPCREATATNPTSGWRSAKRLR